MRSSEFIDEQKPPPPKTPEQMRVLALKQQMKNTQAQLKRERAQQAVRKAQQQMTDALKP